MRSKIRYEEFKFGRIVGRAMHPLHGCPCYLIRETIEPVGWDDKKEVIDKTLIITSMIDRIEVLSAKIKEQGNTELIELLDQLI